VAYDAVAASDGLAPAVREFNSASKLYTANFRSLGLGPDQAYRRFGDLEQALHLSAAVQGRTEATTLT
jgi:hypothetical protein